MVDRSAMSWTVMASKFFSASSASSASCSSLRVRLTRGSASFTAGMTKARHQHTAAWKVDPALIGDLTIKGVTRPVRLKVKRYGEISDARMGHRVAYSAEGEINRKDFGLTANMLVDGRWVVGDEVKIAIELELVEQKQEAMATA